VVLVRGFAPAHHMSMLACLGARPPNGTYLPASVPVGSPGCPPRAPPPPSMPLDGFLVLDRELSLCPQAWVVLFSVKCALLPSLQEDKMLSVGHFRAPCLQVLSSLVSRPLLRFPPVSRGVSSRAFTWAGHKTFALGRTPKPNKDFYISTVKDVERVHQEATDGSTILVRGPPATGKSTLAEALRDTHPCTKESMQQKKRSYVYIAAQHLGTSVSGANATVVNDKLKELLNEESNLNGELPSSDTPVLKDTHAVLKWLADRNVALAVDEAHLIFETQYDPHLKSLYSAFLKHDSQPTVLFFTTTSESVRPETGTIQHSPAEIGKKFFWPGKFEVADVVAALEFSPIQLDDKAAEALAHVSGLHRGIFVRLGKWVQDIQEQRPDREGWSEKELYRHIKLGMERMPGVSCSHFETYLHASRAVKVNGGLRIPRPFLYALAKGAINNGDEKFSAQEMVLAVTAGFLQPKPTSSVSGALVPYNDYYGTFVLGNQLQADHYQDEPDKQGMVFHGKPFNTAADVVLEIVPKLRLYSLLDPVHHAAARPFSATGAGLPVPHEDCWNDQIRKLFGRGAGTHHSSDKGLGMPDFTCAFTDESSESSESANRRVAVVMDSVMAQSSSIQLHFDRFLPEGIESKKLYQPSSNVDINLRSLLIIGGNKDDVKRNMAAVKRGKGSEDVEILGLCPRHGYTAMTFCWFTSEGECLSEDVACDSVPQRLRDNKIVVGRVVGASRKKTDPSCSV
jgi:hypothetical protein